MSTLPKRKPKSLETKSVSGTVSHTIGTFAGLEIVVKTDPPRKAPTGFRTGKGVAMSANLRDEV